MSLALNVVYMVALGIPAMILHEGGHISAAWFCGVKVKRIGISRTGFYTVREQGPRWANVCISFAGPAVNLLIAIAVHKQMPTFAFVNLIACVFNLLPLPNSDGRRILSLFAPARAVTGRVSHPQTLSQ
jgi:Zn-dependent protease